MNFDWIKQGTACWTTDKQRGFRPALVRKVDIFKDRAQLQFLQGQTRDFQFRQLIQRNNYQREWDNLDELPVLNQPQLLHNLCKRYRLDKIYTQIGDTLIVINPYKAIQNLYSEQAIITFSSIKATPHIFRTTALALSSLPLLNQTVIIGGESGSGKTQNTKRALLFLTRIESLQQSNKLLSMIEAFGNAKTLRNDNSSRFGKYLKVFYKDEKIAGASITKYLLQKSRVTQVGQGECSYHILYYASQYTGLKLNKYFNQEFHPSPPERRKQLYQQVLASLRVLNFSDSEINSITNILLAVICLADVEFNQEGQKTQIINKQSALTAARYLGVSQIDILTVLTCSKNKFYEKPLTQSEAYANLFALNRSIFDNLFSWIIKKLNQAISASQCSKFIGMLDIFGFECFEHNSLEQLLINYSNERLQLMYIQSLKIQIEIQYREEQLYHHIQNIRLPDNTTLLQAFQNVQPKSGLFNQININNLLNYSIAQIASSVIKNYPKAFERAKVPNCLAVNHTPRSVVYDLQNFKEKNSDVVRKQILQFINSTSDVSLKAMWVQANDPTKLLISKFHQEMLDLRQELGKCQRSFVRCIKPNQQKAADKIQIQLLMTQVRYLGLLQSIKLRKFIFPYKSSYQDCYSRFRHLDPKYRRIARVAPEELFSSVKQLLQTVLVQKQNEFLMGKTKCYFKQQEYSKLSNLIFRLQKQSAEKLIRSYRQYRFRKITLKSLKRLISLHRALVRLRILQSKHFTKFAIQNVANNIWLTDLRLRLSARLQQRCRAELERIKEVRATMIINSRKIFKYYLHSRNRKKTFSVLKKVSRVIRWVKLVSSFHAEFEHRDYKMAWEQLICFLYLSKVRLKLQTHLALKLSQQAQRSQKMIKSGQKIAKTYRKLKVSRILKRTLSIAISLNRLSRKYIQMESKGKILAEQAFEIISNSTYLEKLSFTFTAFLQKQIASQIQSIKLKWTQFQTSSNTIIKAYRRAKQRNKIKMGLLKILTHKKVFSLLAVVQKKKQQSGLYFLQELSNIKYLNLLRRRFQRRIQHQLKKQKEQEERKAPPTPQGVSVLNQRLLIFNILFFLLNILLLRHFNSDNLNSQ